jgi:hypothetical protein
LFFSREISIHQRFYVQLAMSKAILWFRCPQAYYPRDKPLGYASMPDMRVTFSVLPLAKPLQLHQIGALRVPSIRKFSDPHALFQSCDIPNIYLLHRLPGNPLGMVADGLRYGIAGNRTIRSAYPDTFFRCGTPTCNAYFRWCGSLWIQEPVSHLPKAHGNHKVTHADNRTGGIGISLHKE